MDLFDELRRRKVVRAAVVYGAAAFALLEFADIAFPRLGLPDDAVDAVLWVGILGFPIALVVAWWVDVVPEGGRVGWLSWQTVAAAAALVLLGIALGRGLDRAEARRPVPAPVRAPALAVVPFENLSGEDAWFSVGLTEEIATALSRFGSIRVIAPRSARDVEGAPEGVDYLLVGTVRQDATRVRVSARLVEVSTGAQVWADGYDRGRDAAELLAAQDDIAHRVVSRIADPAGAVPRAELARKAPDSYEVYACVLRAFAYLVVHTEETHRAALDCLEPAIELAPDYADAWAQLAYLYREEFHHNRVWHDDPLDRAMEASQRAIDLDPANPWGYFALSMTQYSRGELAAGAAAIDRALDLNPNDSATVAVAAWYRAFAGDVDRGLELANRAVALNPLHPSWLHLVFATAYYRQGEYDVALRTLHRANLPNDAQYLIILAATNARLGNAAEARAALEHLIGIDPTFAADPFAEVDRYFIAEVTASGYREGLREAGLIVGPDGRAALR